MRSADMLSLIQIQGTECQFLIRTAAFVNVRFELSAFPYREERKKGGFGRPSVRFGAGVRNDPCDEGSTIRTHTRRRRTHKPSKPSSLLQLTAPNTKHVKQP